MTDDQLLELDKELAKALGYFDIVVMSNRELYVHSNDDEFWQIRWSVDNDEAFKLVCEYEITLISFDGAIHANGVHKEVYSEHASREAATRVVIVKATIADLKGLA